MTAVIPDFYQTTYQETFQAKVPPHRRFEPPKTRDTIYCIESSNPFGVSPSEPFPEKRNDYGPPKREVSPKIVKANVDKSGFWAQTPLIGNANQQGKNPEPLKSTSQEYYTPPRRLDVLAHLKQAQGINFKAETPFGREPITTPSEDPMANQSVEHSMYTIHPKPSIQIPQNVVMEPTGFQRSITGDKAPAYKPTELTEAEIKRFQQSDPVEYRSVRTGQAKMMSVNQMFYQDPHMYQRRK